MLLGDFLPSRVSAYGVVPFIVLIVGSFIGSIAFMRYFWKRRERDRVCLAITSLGLWIALLTSFLLPLDVFLVSFMKDSDGKFKDWATNSTRISVESGMSYAYYTAYIVILLFVFLLLPWVYFFYEEKDDEQHDFRKRCCTSVCYAGCFVIGASVLLLVGALVPYRKVPTGNGTEIEALERIISSMYNNKGIDALYFILNILMVIGMVMLVIYNGLGMSIYPIMCIRGGRTMKQESEILEDKRATISAKKSTLTSKDSLSRRQRQTLNQLQDEERLLSRMENEINSVSQGCCYKLTPFFKVFQVIFGCVGILIGALVWTAVLLAMIDKLLYSLGYESGYLVTEVQIPNPLDFILVECQKVFPIDYIFYFVIVIFLLGSTVGGIREIGICCVCVRVFSIRPHKTQPQALILLCFILMYYVLALNYFMFSAAPQYTTYGSQQYFNSTSNSTLPCNPLSPEGECIMTRASTFLLGFTTKAWIFAVTYYWMTWAFLIIVITGFIYAVFRSKKSYINEAVDRDDFEDSDSDVHPIVA